MINNNNLLMAGNVYVIKFVNHPDEFVIIIASVFKDLLPVRGTIASMDPKRKKYHAQKIAFCCDDIKEVTRIDFEHAYTFLKNNCAVLLPTFLRSNNYLYRIIIDSGIDLSNKDYEDLKLILRSATMGGLRGALPEKKRRKAIYCCRHRKM